MSNYLLTPAGNKVTPTWKHTLFIFIPTVAAFLAIAALWL